MENLRLGKSLDGRYRMGVRARGVAVQNKHIVVHIVFLQGYTGVVGILEADGWEWKDRCKHTDATWQCC